MIIAFCFDIIIICNLVSCDIYISRCRKLKFYGIKLRFINMGMFGGSQFCILAYYLNLTYEYRLLIISMSYCHRVGHGVFFYFHLFLRSSRFLESYFYFLPE